MKPQDHVLYVFFMWGRPADVDWQIEANSLAENVYIEKVTMHEHSDVERDVFCGFCNALAHIRSIKCLQICEIKYGAVFTSVAIV